jgi:hypothetical protein
MSNKPYFSLAIKGDSKNTLDSLTSEHGLTQSEVIEALLDSTNDLAVKEALHNMLVAKKAQKMQEREALHAKKKSIRKAISGISPDELQKLLRENGLLTHE